MSISPLDWLPTTPEDTMLRVAGQDFYHHTPAKAWSLSSPDGDEIRFEIRSGDRYAGAHADSVGTERCEIGQVARPAINQEICVDYEFLIEPGAPFTTRWMVMGQLHSALDASPPVEIKFNGDDRMAISGNSGTSSNIRWRDLWKDSAPIERGRWHKMRIHVRLSSKGDGFAKIWRNGELIVDYAGALGYTDQTRTYWKQGIYRAGAPETVVARFRRLHITEGYAPPLDEPAPAPQPEPIPEPAPEPVPTEPLASTIDVAATALLLEEMRLRKANEGRFAALEARIAKLEGGPA